MFDFPVTILDADGVETFWTTRDAAWLCAVAAQIDADRAAEKARFDLAYVALWNRLAQLIEESGGR